MVCLDKSGAWKNAEYWRQLCPNLTITNDSNSSSRTNNHDNTLGSIKHNKIDEKITNKIFSQLKVDGYSLVDFSNIIHDGNESNETNFLIKPKLLSKIASSIETLTEKNIPASMIFLYDEVWEISQVAGQLISQSTHTLNIPNFDMLAWNINASKNECGFSPHRDRQPEDKQGIKESFHSSNGQAKYITLWLALTDATPENSCLYVIPQQFDPGYYEGDDNDEANSDNSFENETDNRDVKDPLQLALTSKESYQNIRAIPRLSGQAVLFTHRILHWGSKGNPQCKNPRIALSFVSSDPQFEKAYISPSHFNPPSSTPCAKNTNGFDTNISNENSTLPSFKIRLVLVCAQLLIYYQRLNLDITTIRSCYNFCKENEHILEDTYRKKVYVEFVKAMKESQQNNTQNNSIDSSSGHMQNGKTVNKESNKKEIKNMTATTKFLCDKTSGDEDDNEQLFKKQKISPFGNVDEDEDSDEDKMLNAMIDAEDAGYNEFQDDYDDEFEDEEN